MNNLQFNIMRLIKEEDYSDTDQFARTLYKDHDEVNTAIKNLESEGFLNEGALSKKGLQELESHRIDNAVILAAGMSTRFVPLNFETPKGLLKVNGETLIERQIRQLTEKGINDISIVVGYMKEKFDCLKDKYGVRLIETDDYATRNNHASVFAAKDYLKNTIITSSDLYFSENVFQTYAFDSYYCTTFVPGKTAERGIETDTDDKIVKTFYGDKCYDIWVTLGYAFFSEDFSKKMIDFISKEYDFPETVNKFWADIQDEHLSDLYMYAKRCDDDVIHEFDSLEELRQFDKTYLENSGSKIMKQLCYVLAVDESGIVGLESLKQVKPSMFKFRCRGDVYVCDVNPDERDRITYQGRVYYPCRDLNAGGLKLYKMDKNIRINGGYKVDVNGILDTLYDYSYEFKKYHDEALPLCAAENVISPFANLPLSFGFQERYIMNNTYSFNMDDNFIGCEKLFPFYQAISDACERIFGAKYTDPRPFSGMHCIDMITKCVCKPGDKMMILDKSAGGHASVKPVVERLGVETFPAPYNFAIDDLDYDKVNQEIAEKGIGFILLAPSDLIKSLEITKIDTTNCVLLYDCSQLMGLIAAGLIENPLKTMKNIIMFGGTHKTFPGPASGLIMTNEKYLHDEMETMINPTLLRHSQMHQKICLLFALIEFEQYGAEYMSHMVHCSNYIGKRLKEDGLDIGEFDGHISQDHQVFIYTSKDVMDTIYDNAYKCRVTLNKKHKTLFHDYGIRLGTQEIARYNWDDSALDTVAAIVEKLLNPNVYVEEVRKMVDTLPEKKVHFTFPDEVVDRFRKLMHD
jgi:CTP:phosphocholine cytidylyltransferase-like protein/glycine/serine hydroxymethyltransferase